MIKNNTISNNGNLISEVKYCGKENKFKLI